jgi:hypothetical protein
MMHPAAGCMTKIDGVGAHTELEIDAKLLQVVLLFM